MRAAIVQMTASDDPAENCGALTAAVDRAAAEGATHVFTPEVCNCVSGSRTRQREVLAEESADVCLAAMRDRAARHGIWILLGSLALAGGPAGRFINRSLLLRPDGGIAARYDKIHMFDVDLSDTESYRESAAFVPGEAAVTAVAGGVCLGLTICYDLRFAYLHRALAKAGAQVLAVPANFAVPTGRDHWEVLLRARAIETGCFVVAPAQSGRHSTRRGPERRSWGHSLVVDPWGHVLLDAGEEPGVHLVDIEIAEVSEARGRVPALAHDRAFRLP